MIKTSIMSKVPPKMTTPMTKQWPQRLNKQQQWRRKSTRLRLWRNLNKNSRQRRNSLNRSLLSKWWSCSWRRTCWSLRRSRSGKVATWGLTCGRSYPFIDMKRNRFSRNKRNSDTHYLRISPYLPRSPFKWSSCTLMPVTFHFRSAISSMSWVSSPNGSLAGKSQMSSSKKERPSLISLIRLTLWKDEMVLLSHLASSWTGDWKLGTTLKNLWRL